MTLEAIRGRQAAIRCINDAEDRGRLILFAAADGFGAFNGNTVVTMDAAQGGFSASENWQNDIAGAPRRAAARRH